MSAKKWNQLMHTQNGNCVGADEGFNQLAKLMRDVDMRGQLPKARGLAHPSNDRNLSAKSRWDSMSSSRRKPREEEHGPAGASKNAPAAAGGEAYLSGCSKDAA